MNKVELLFVRACKSGKGLKRVESIYRRFYNKSVSYQVQRQAIISILLNICETYCPIGAFVLVNRLNPDSTYIQNRYDGEYDYERVLLDFLIDRISVEPKYIFEGL